MAYFIFNKNSDKINGSLCKIAENKSDLDNLNIIQSNYNSRLKKNLQEVAII